MGTAEEVIQVGFAKLRETFFRVEGFVLTGLGLSILDSLGLSKSGSLNRTSGKRKRAAKRKNKSHQLVEMIPFTENQKKRKKRKSDQEDTSSQLAEIIPFAE